MSDTYPGPHHCLGTARAVADIVYRSMRAQCVARGGTLTVEDLERCYAEIVESFASGFDMFERRHMQCMRASLGMAEMPFAREHILATVLRACGEEAVRQAFTSQVEQLDEAWLRPFFDAFAEYVRHHLCADAENRLTAAYVEVALARQGRFSLGELLKHRIVQNALRDCARPLSEQPVPATLVRQACDTVNVVLLSGAETPVNPVDDEQMTNFFGLLVQQIAMQMPSGLALHEAELVSLAEHKKKNITPF